MYVCVAGCMYMYHMCAGDCGGQKKVLGPMALGWQVAVSCPVGARNQTNQTGTMSSVNHLAISPAPGFCS